MSGGCMICNLYTVIDRHGDASSDLVAELVSALPPRGHAFHTPACGGGGGGMSPLLGLAYRLP